MLKRILCLCLVMVLSMFMMACGKGENAEVEHGVPSEVSIDEMSIRDLISGYAFETLTENEDEIEAYVFFEDGTLYYIGASIKVGTWKIENGKVVALYDVIDGEVVEETQILEILLKSEIGITINGIDFMMIDTAENYVN